jgi:hypothetical protein
VVSKPFFHVGQLGGKFMECDPQRYPHRVIFLLEGA